MLMQKLRKMAVNYDVFHVHCCSNWGFLPAVIGIKVGKKLKKRIVLTYHGGGGESFFDKHSRLVRRYLTHTDVNIVLSGFLAKVFEKHQLPFTVIPNIVEMDGSQFKDRPSIQPRFICIRAHEELYNIPCILRAFLQVQRQIPEATLMLVGGGSLHEDLMRQAEHMGIPNVVFTGRVDNSEIMQYLDQADVMLSAPKVDNMPVSLIEAMNAGLLVISSRVGGVPYIIEDGVNGLLFESNQDVELAEKMIWVMEHQDLAHNMVMKAKQSIQQYQWTNVKDKLFASYGILT
jgi:glycosyltransferase involved in cell wall biosynthesis